MEPGEFIKVLDQNGQIPGMIGEIARGKALAVVLSKAKVVDSKGKDVDLTTFTAGVLEDDENFVEADAGDHEGHDHEGHSHS
jgi:trigger factor